MKLKTLIIPKALRLVLVLTLLYFPFISTGQPDKTRIDGPYILKENGAMFSYSVAAGGTLVKTKVDTAKPLNVHVPNADKDHFEAKLKGSHNTEADEYPMPAKLLVISDLEGNYNGLYSFLTNNGVMDKTYNWTFKDGHVVFVGDFVDRGEYVTQVLWLIYMLEEKAKQHNGKVHYILGNHEVMNLQGNVNYVRTAYVKTAQQISGQQDCNKAYKYLFSTSSELGKWLRTKNIIEKIGPYIFVHAGINHQLLDYKPTITSLNETVRTHMDAIPDSGTLAAFIMSKYGPFWYRGMVRSTKRYKKMPTKHFNEVLAYFKAEKIVIGHTLGLFNNIRTGYNKRLIKIDVKHGQEKNSGKTKGLFVENGLEYKVDDRGRKKPL